MPKGRGGLIRLLIRTNSPDTNRYQGFSLFVQHERILTGANPQRALIAGSVQPEANIWPDVQEPHIRLLVVDKVAKSTEVR